MDDEKSLTSALKGGLEGLAYLAHQAIKRQNSHEFFSQLCCFVIPLIHQSQFLLPLRKKWEDEKNQHIRRTRALEKQVVNEVTSACSILEERVTRPQESLDCQNAPAKLANVRDILKTGGLYLGSPYYRQAFDALKDACRYLAHLEKKEILKGIGTVTYINHHTNGPDPKFTREPLLEYVHFHKGIELLREHQEEKEHLINTWAVWECLCLAEACWHLPKSYFDKNPIEMGSAASQQRSDHLFNLRRCWYEMQCIRTRRVEEGGPPVTFTLNSYLDYLEHILSAIVFWHSLEKEAPSRTSPTPIYALELHLHQNEIHLVVEWQKNGERSVYLLHECRDESIPHLFMKKLIENLGHPINLSDVDPGNQPSSKKLNDLGIKEPLRSVFFGKGKTRSAILERERAILEELPNIDATELTRYVTSLGITQIEGDFSRIQYGSDRERTCQ